MYKWEESCELNFSFFHFEVTYMYHNFLSMIAKIKQLKEINYTVVMSLSCVFITAVWDDATSSPLKCYGSVKEVTLTKKKLSSLPAFSWLALVPTASLSPGPQA